MAFVAERGDLLGCSTLGSVGMGWFILLYLISVVNPLDGSNIGAMRLGFTLGENTGRGGNLVGGLSGACVGGRVLRSMWPCLLLLLDIGCEEDWCVASARGLGVVKRKYGEAANSNKISLRCGRSVSGDYCKHADILPLSTDVSLPTAAIMVLARVTFGFEMYLCL